MIVTRDTEILKDIELVATIGFFDGVHLGHRFLIEEMLSVARSRKLPAAVITFPEHPRAVLHADYQPKLLNSFEEKLMHLESTGVDYCIVLDFTPELSQLSAKEFIQEILCKRIHVNTLLIGYDHRFGRNRADGFEQYVEYGKSCGMDVIQASPYSPGMEHVSSSEVRKQLDHCRVDKAAALLGYPYMIKGSIVSGYKIGRTIGFPTANIRVDEPFKVLPGIGIYAVWVNLNGVRYKGMLYIGCRPTIDNNLDMALEVNILNFSGDIYNAQLEVIFVRFMREDIKFESLEALRAQLEIDREEVDVLLSGLE